MRKPVLYYSRASDDNKFHLSAKRYEEDSDAWETNNIELRAIWTHSDESTFINLSNILAQAGIVLLRDC